VHRRDFLVFVATSTLAACRSTATRNEGRITAWGGSGHRDGQFRQPRAIGVMNGEVYVIDKTGRIQVFDEHGTFKRTWSTPAQKNGTPTCVSFSRRDTVLVPDTHYSRIFEYAPEGKTLEMWGSYGKGPDEFIYPTGIVEDDKGFYYISEYGMGAERIHVFDAQRHYVRQWGTFGEKKGQFNRAMDIVIDDEEALYVVDSANHRIQCFGTDGKFRHSIGGLGKEPGKLEFPYDAALAPDGTLVVCEYGNSRVSRFKLSGEFVAVYGGVGRAPGQFNGPRGIAVDEKGAIYVADTDNDRIQRMEVEGMS